MTMPEFERAVLPADISRPRRLVNRVIGAWRDGGISRLGAEARQMALWRANLWVLDRLLDSSEASEIAQTARLGSLDPLPDDVDRSQDCVLQGCRHKLQVLDVHGQQAQRLERRLGLRRRQGVDLSAHGPPP